MSSARPTWRWLSFPLTIVLLAASYFVVARSCGYDHRSVACYLGYVSLHIGLPGCVFLGFAQKRWPSLLELFALGLPLGFATEIGLFFVASALHLKAFLPVSPFLWLALGFLVWKRIGHGPSTAVCLIEHGLERWCAVAALIFAFTVTIASQFYACAPLLNGVLGTSTNHDWIYLLSRAGEIKERWPLQDPSLAGAPLSYHYFLLVHLASASFVTGIKLELLGLRLCVLPLSAALMAQALFLGKSLTGSLRGGIIAVGLLFTANELSFQDPSAGSSFASEFVRWLFISPTFFFGMIFTGALLLWIYRLLSAAKLSITEGLILGVLAAAGTGAKGTVVPPLLVALSIWAVIETVQLRRLPIKTALLLAALGGGFSLVYFTILSDWGTGAAAVAPLFSIKLSQFWREHADVWATLLESWGISSVLSISLAHLACVIAVLVGFSGIRLLGFVAVWRWKEQLNPKLTCWLGLTAAMYFVFGHLLVLDSNSQLYLLYPVRLPQAVLTASVGLWIFSGVKARMSVFAGRIGAYSLWTALICFTAVLTILVFTGHVSWWLAVVLVSLIAFLFAPTPKERVALRGRDYGQFLWRVSPLVAVLAVTLIQVNHWRLSNVQGFKLWLTQSAVSADENVVLLRQAMDWIRTNTPPESVLVANAFSEKNLRPDAVARLDNTTVDKYYYYSAFAERRLWVEGPTYLRDQYAAARRITTASQVFSGGPVSLFFNEEKGRPDYILLDRSLDDGATVRLPPERCVYENARIAVYRLAAPTPVSQERIAAILR